jgi:ADP-heptose:LPS heptosyltransferase
MQKLLLKQGQCPGDVLVTTAALESLHRQYPGQYLTDVDTTCNAIFENNPHVTKLDRLDGEVRRVEMSYPLINKSDHQPCHFLQGFTEWLGNQLSVKLECSVKRPYLYLSDEEKSWVNQVEQETGYKGHFWLINAGTKADYTVKGWGHFNYQAAVDALYPNVVFVQVGESHHNHKTLRNVIDFIGKTDARQLIRLAYHAQGALTGESFLHHLFAAFQKPCVTLCSGFLPPSWVWYPTAQIITRFGCLPCCQDRGCWKARVVKQGDGDSKDNSICALPMLSYPEPIPKCMAMIRVDEVVRAIQSYYLGGLLRY